MHSEISSPADEQALIAALTRVIERRMAHSLIVSDGVSERIFYFAIGGIRVIRSGPRKTASVADILTDSGKLSAEDMGRVVAASKQDGLLFGETVFALGLLKQEDLDEAIRVKVQEEVLDLFLWDGAEIRLQEGQPPKSFYEGRFEAARLSCDVQAFLQTVLARVDEWRGVLGRLPSCREVYEATDAAKAEFADGANARLVAQIDGQRSIADAIAKAGARRVPSYEFLLGVMDSNKVRRVTTSAAQKVSRDEAAREIELLEDALKFAIDPSIVRVRLARVLETIGENSRAATEWRQLGDDARRENQLVRALECYRNAVRVVPTDFATRELILEIHRHNRDNALLIQDGRPLADLFLKHNLLNRAKNLLVQLCGIELQDAQLRRQLVMVLIGLGERDLALKTLRELAKLLEQKKAPVSELRDVYVRILALDKKDKVAQDKLDGITGARFQRRMLRATVVATAAAVLCLVGWFISEAAARRDVNTAIEAASKQVQDKDYAAAKETLKQTIADHPYAKGATTANNMLQQIERYELKERERLGAGVESGRSAQQRDEAAAAALAQRAKDLAEAGKVDDAYRAYRELFEVFADVPLVDSVSLPLKVTVLPLDARVRLAGQEVGQGALTLRYSPHAKSTLTVEAKGYATFKKLLDAPQEAAMEVALEKPTKWVFTSDAAIDAQPALSAGMVYVAGRDRCITAVSAADGAPQWRAPLGLYSDVCVRPVVTSEGVFVATASGEAVCLNASTGEVVWRKDVGAPVERQPAAAAGDGVLVNADDGSVRVYAAATGAAKWALPAASAVAPPVAIEDGALAYVDPRGALVFASSDNGAAMPGYSQPAVLRGTPVPDEGGRLWVRAEDGSLCIIATATRRALRRCPVPNGADFGPTVAGEVAYAVATDGGVYAFRASGEPLFRVKLEEAASAAPAISKGRLYVPGQKGRMYVLDAQTGALIWRFDAKSRITATPLISAGTIYVPTAGGKLFAVEE
jgi:outer membrane protein assembly factor BamB/tetratricopeptide (TPR) repeat protein